MGRERSLPTAHEMKFENSRIGMHLFRTDRAPTVLVSLQPINTKNSRGAEGVFTVYKTKQVRYWSLTPLNITQMISDSN